MAGILRPNTDVIEGQWTVNSASDSNGTTSTGDLFDGIRGDWSSVNTFYWNTSSNYIDITLHQNSAIWVLPNPSYLSYNKGLKVSKWNGSSFDDLYTLGDRTTLNEWEKMVELEKGRYKFSYASNYRMDDEWFIEALLERRTLLKSNNKIYAIHEQENNGENLSKNVINVTASGGTTPEKTIDGNTTLSQSYSWYSVNLPSAWIKYEFNKPIHIDKINILSAYFSGYEAIKNFQLEGSKTGDFTGEEVVIYSGIHPNDTTKDFVTYEFRNSGKYKFYRINVLDIYVGNGNNNLSIVEVEFYSNLTELIQVPKDSMDNFIKYGVSNISFDGVIINKNYILQDTVSENADGLWVQEIDRKPLSIKFE